MAWARLSAWLELKTRGRASWSRPSSRLNTDRWFRDLNRWNSRWVRP